MTVYSVILLMLPSKLNQYERKEEISNKLFHDDKKLFLHVEILKALNQIGIDLIQVSISTASYTLELKAVLYIVLATILFMHVL